MKATARCLIVAMTIFSWIAISNHCALDVFGSQENVAQNECPFHSHSAKPDKQKESTGQPCCKSLRALAPSLVKHPTPAIVDSVDADFSIANLVVVLPPKISFYSVALDTGPPGTTSFAELIGSMRAHAPPTFA